MKTRLHGFETSIQSCSYFEIHSVLLKSNFHTHLKQMIIWKVYFIRFIFETLWIVSYLWAFYIRALLTSTIKYLSTFRHLMFLIQRQPGGSDDYDEANLLGYTPHSNILFGRGFAVCLALESLCACLSEFWSLRRTRTCSLNFCLILALEIRFSC